LKLLGSGNPKTLKGEKLGYLTFILHLAPAQRSGYQVCPCATEGCKAACLNTAGRGRFDKTQAARIRKTRMFFEDRENFLIQLVKDIEAGIRKGDRGNMIPVFRLNGTSDIRWEVYPVVRDGVTYPNIFGAFPDIQFYDYTKIPNRRNIPSNYHLTFSRADGNEHNVNIAVGHGMNIAVVFSTPKKDDLPETYMGFPVYDADEHDLRFLDPYNHISGLRAKGQAKGDLTGFVVNI